MSNTANYNLKTWATSEITDSFNNFVFGVAGDVNSNMTKIDTQMKSSADGVSNLKNAPIKNVFANMISDSYYTATILDYSAYVSGNIFLLTLDITCHDTLTININSIGTVSVMKYKPDGNIYNVSAGDIIANAPVLMAYDGTRWIILNDIKAGEISTGTDTTISGLLKGDSNKIAQAVAGTDYMPMSGGNMTGAINEALVSSMALAGTMNIGAAAGNYIIVTAGTGPITAFDSAPAGARRFMRFSVPTTINYNATTMLIPGAANLAVVSGDVLEWVSGGSGVWRCVNIERWNRIEPSTLQDAIALKMEATLLWTNGAPGSTFAAQTISGSWAGYNSFVVEYYVYVAAVGSRCVAFLAAGASQDPFYYIGAYGTNYWRNTTPSSTGVVFGDCYLRADNGTATADNNKMIPYKVWGLKGLTL